jgi:hypothetical protein
VSVLYEDLLHLCNIATRYLAFGRAKLDAINECMFQR